MDETTLVVQEWLVGACRGFNARVELLNDIMSFYAGSIGED